MFKYTIMFLLKLAIVILIFVGIYYGSKYLITYSLEHRGGLLYLLIDHVRGCAYENE